MDTAHQVLPQYREYERFSTNGLNAFVGPKVARYVERFDSALRSALARPGVLAEEFAHPQAGTMPVGLMSRWTM